MQEASKLWFDVGVKRYTTNNVAEFDTLELWFDVGVNRYTTGNQSSDGFEGCGLM